MIEKMLLHSPPKMASLKQLLLLIPQILTVISLTVAVAVAQPVWLGANCTTTANYTANSTYQKNFHTLLSSLSPNIDNYGFYSSSSNGQNSDRAYAMALCRGDVSQDTCRSCINNSTTKVPETCPNNKEAVGWYDMCMLRYSDKSVNGSMTTSVAQCLCNTNNATNTDQFNEKVGNLLSRLRGVAAAGGSRRKYAAGNASGLEFQTIYGLVQCTPDLSEKQCNDCLTSAFNLGCCGGKIGGRVLFPSCNFRFEIGQFFQEIPADAPPPSPPPPSPGKDSHTTKIVIIIVVSSVTFVIALIVVICIYKKKRKKSRSGHEVQTAEFPNTNEISTVQSLQYDFNTLCDATDNFSNANKLGQGGFGIVYKGKLYNRQEIAVKRLSANSGQGEQEFKNEVMLVAKLQHRNLVRLLGFCLQGIERLLVYEFVPNSSLNHFLFDPIKRAYLNWERRYKIIVGIARGLLYLHEDSRLRIIHRDLKASNVLLDAEMNPKISDFGMARLFVMDETQGSTSRIAGTYGYIAPEYAVYGHFSVKSDVFSLGVLILEIISGQKNSCFKNGEDVEHLLSYVWKAWGKGTISYFIDPMLRSGSTSMSEMMRCIHIGMLCVQENVSNRPTMGSIFLMLSNMSLTLPTPLEPTFFMHNIMNPTISLLQENSSGSARTIESDNSKINPPLYQSTRFQLQS